jgi:hypothetical protein
VAGEDRRAAVLTDHADLVARLSDYKRWIEGLAVCHVPSTASTLATANGLGDATPVSMADTLKAHAEHEHCPKHPMAALWK